MVMSGRELAMRRPPDTRAPHRGGRCRPAGRHGRAHRGRDGGARGLCRAGRMVGLAAGGAVHHDRAAARNRCGRRRDRGELARGGGFRGGLELQRGGRSALVDAACQRLVEPHEQAGGALVAVLRGGRGQRNREERGQRCRRRVQLADRRAARRAVAQVRPDLHELLGRRLAVDDRGEQR